MKKITIIIAVLAIGFTSCGGPRYGCKGQTCDKHGHTTIVGFTPYKP